MARTKFFLSVTRIRSFVHLNLVHCCGCVRNGSVDGARAMLGEQFFLLQRKEDEGNYENKDCVP